MPLPTRTHTAGNRRRFIVDYRQYLNRGVSVASFTAEADSDDITLDDVSVQADGTCVFFIDGGEAGLEFTVTVTMTSSKDEVKIDVVPFLVIAP